MAGRWPEDAAILTWVGDAQNLRWPCAAGHCLRASRAAL